jgi:redox-sensitive bicupin YhaK (pirin superfamily)
MITRRPSDERGQGQFGWLQARYSFSFSGYYDAKHMGHSVLRVINQDIVRAKSGFGQHGHDNMEILTYVLSGTLSHRDTLGNIADITAGEFQLMSAGTGIEHSEMNRGDVPVELLQIWLQPNVRNLAPRYAQKSFERTSGLTCIVAPDSEVPEALPIRQDARIYRGILSTHEQLSQALHEGRKAWLQLISGRIRVNGQLLMAGDGAAIHDETELTLQAEADSEFLYFDLP